MAKRKMPVKTVDLDFAEDGYEGFHAQRRTNAPVGLTRRYLEIDGMTGSEEEARAIILKLFPSWDFVDDDGKAIPHTHDGLDLLPPDLIAAMHVRGIRALRNGVMSGPLGKGSSTELGDKEQTS